MMNYEEYDKLRRSRVGRKCGHSYSFTIKDVYDSLKASGDLKIDYRTFRKILRSVGSKVWSRLYKGQIIAIPYLFNMEIVPNNLKWPRKVNWKRTHQLWSEDEEAFKDRLLVRHEPSKYFVRIKHSTVSRNRKHWFYPSMVDIHLSKKRQREIDSKYELII